MGSVLLFPKGGIMQSCLNCHELKVSRESVEAKEALCRCKARYPKKIISVVSLFETNLFISDVSGTKCPHYDQAGGYPTEGIADWLVKFKKNFDKVWRY
jgi:hypothetical protein